MGKLLFACMCLLALLVCTAFAIPTRGQDLGRGLSRNEGNARGENGQEEDKITEYIIVTKEGEPQASQQKGMSCKMFLEDTMHLARSRRSTEPVPMVVNYTGIGIGYAAKMNKMALDMVNRLEDVDFVEENQEVWAAEIQLGYHTDRIDQRDLPLDKDYSPKYTGKDLDIYVLDTGIRYSHTVFGGRAAFGGYDDFGGKGEDCNSHGTHVAALAGGNITGAAVGANLYSIKVLGCNSGGSYEGVIKGINHVVERVKENGRKSIISMSIQAPRSLALNRALKMAYEAGIVNVVAAGNYKKDACKYSPSSSPHTITVAGSSKNDRMYWTSGVYGTNHGDCVDIFAPGQNVYSASHRSDTGVVSKSGTSMATPIVSGVVAMLLEEDSSLTPEQVKEELIKRSTKDVLDFGQLPYDGRKNSPNRLVFVEKVREAEPVPSSTSLPQPTSTAATTLVMETVTMTTESASTPTPTPTPAPVLEPLPEKPNLISPNVLLDDAEKDVIHKKESGFVPSHVNAYVMNKQQHFTISYKYVGASNVDGYMVLPDLLVQDLDSFMNTVQENGMWSPFAIAPYDNNGKAAIFLVLKLHGGDCILSSNKTADEFNTENSALSTQGYQPVMLRYLQLEDGSTKVYTIYQKWAKTLVITEMKLSEVIGQAYSLRQAGNYLLDVTYEMNKDGDITYSGIFQKETTNADVFYVDVRYNIPTLFSVHTVLKNVGYHSVALTPLMDHGLVQTGFLTVYWR